MLYIRRQWSVMILGSLFELYVASTIVPDHQSHCMFEVLGDRFWKATASPSDLPGVSNFPVIQRTGHSSSQVPCTHMHPIFARSLAMRPMCSSVEFQLVGLLESPAGDRSQYDSQCRPLATNLTQEMTRAQTPSSLPCSAIRRGLLARAVSSTSQTLLQ